ncbi:MAG: PilZ domain-containing protein [Acidobacteriota bacterium]
MALTVERRRSPRHRISLRGRILPAGGQEVPVEVVNLSLEAALVRGPLPFRLLRKATLRMALGKETFESAAVCVRASEKEPWEGAFLFLSPSERALSALETFLRSLPYPPSGVR